MVEVVTESEVIIEHNCNIKKATQDLSAGKV